MDAIHANYDALRSTPSDINEHLATLRRYASRCGSIAEMGVRAIVSTWALLDGLAASSTAAPKSLWCVDIDAVDTSAAAAAARAVGIDLQFTQCDSALDAALPRVVDMLFIDTLHIKAHLERELAAHHGKVRHYIAMHDTEIDGYGGECVRNALYAAYAPTWAPEVMARKLGYAAADCARGLKPAINEFLRRHPDEWELHERFAHNNGLTILKRIGGVLAAQ